MDFIHSCFFIEFSCNIFGRRDILTAYCFIILFFYGNKKKQCLSIGLFCLLLLIKTLFSYQSVLGDYTLVEYLCYNAEYLMVTAIPLILWYDGTRGAKTLVSKYIFYVAYPIHLWLLMILSHAFGIR